MKYKIKVVLTLFILSIALVVRAQDAKALVAEGVQLSNNKQYGQAIEKFKAALSIDPDNTFANYQIAFSLNALGKGQEALPYLQKVVNSVSSAAIIGSSYGLMGSIYDQSAQPIKAIESYLNGIKADSTNKILWYNLGLAYFRNNQFAEAEESAITSLMAAPEHAPSMRLYALVAFHQNKRAAALFGLCSFLWMEPNGVHSAEANENTQHILQGGLLKAPPGGKETIANVSMYNEAIIRAIAMATKAKYMHAGDLFAAQLQAIFTTVGELAARQKTNGYFHALAANYYQLAQSGNVPAFANFIRQHIDKNAAQWLVTHTNEVNLLQGWMKTHSVSFNP